MMTPLQALITELRQPTAGKAVTLARRVIADRLSVILAQLEAELGDCHLLHAELAKAKADAADGWTHPEEVKIQLSFLERQWRKELERADAAEAKLRAHGITND